MSEKKKTKIEEEQFPEEPSKRSFLNKLWIALGIFAILEFALLVIAYLRPIKRGAKSGDPETIIEAGPVAKFIHNSVTAFIRGKFYLCRLEDGGFLAVSRKCTHLGCTVPWLNEEKRFVCPCHASAFDIKGAVIHPPAPRPLDLYHLFIENNMVKVDTAKRIKRNGFHVEQVVYAKKVQT